jgi:hypothetical protein
MEMILLDWTRMGKSYCLAGVVIDKDGSHVVRPLLAKNREAPVRNTGWSAYQLDGHQRWEVFELVGAETAPPEPPHLEDMWVRTLRSRRCLVPLDYRRVLLQATTARPGETVFGESLQLTHASAYLPPGHGQRSLATLIVPADRIRFSASRRDGAVDADIRAALRIPPLDDRLLPVKDHHLLLRSEQKARSLTEQVQTLEEMVRQMGEQVAVRLGLTRPFQSAPGAGEPRCWLMIDGIFSLSDPQP